MSEQTAAPQVILYTVVNSDGEQQGPATQDYMLARDTGRFIRGQVVEHVYAHVASQIADDFRDLD